MQERKTLALRPNLVLGGIISIGLIICSFQGCSRDSSSSSIPSGSPPVSAPLPVFPLVVSANHRYLQDQNGVPFPILGRTAWFITSLPETDYKRFIDDTVAKGYNAIEFHVINHDRRGNHPPFGPNNTLPFTVKLDGSIWDGSLGGSNDQAPDLSQPSEVYWENVDALLTYAESK
ncbi:MAG TPA: DUF4038 domain-containing protein, partial [Nitrospira sp.]|nr:DUF4038 domain-containing protein [Nitrospira sp.]